MSWSFSFRFSAKNALLDAWIGPIKNPIANAINQKNVTDSIKKRIEVKINKAPIHNFTISFDNQSFDNPNYKCDLTYLDKCNHNDKPDINGIKICKFKHYMDTNTNRSQDEDGIWRHINITQNIGNFND